MKTVRQLLLVMAATAALVVGASVAGAAELPVKPAGVAPQAFPPSTACICHQDLAQQWSKSMHAQALDDPIYRVKRDEADAATDGQLGAFCDTCHAPGATMTGELASGAQLSAGTAESINCSWCHQVSGLLPGEPGNTSQLVTADGTMRAQLKDPQAPHNAMFSETHTKADFCGGCHNVNHPGNGMHLESTFREWADGPYAAQGIVCQDCHMSEKPGVIGPSTGVVGKTGPQRDNVYTMTFVGAQVALGDSEAATARLKSAATVEVAAPEILPAGESSEVTVTITNSGAGHYLPTGLTEVREMWLEISSVNADGTTTPLGERRFGTILQDDKGNAPVELWEATKIKSDDRIPPKGSVTSTVAVEMPAASDAVTITAKLLYRSVPEELAAKAKVENPITEMAAATQAVYSSAEAKAAAQKAAEKPAEPATQSNTTLYLVVGALVLVAGAAAVFVALRKKNAA